jgi:enoyl-CoA hydratase
MLPLVYEMNYTTLKCESPEAGILVVTMNRPEVRNAINSTMMAELLSLWRELASPDVARCVVLTGEGKAFCAGADLKERNGLTVETWREHHINLERAMEAMIACPVPVIAAANGAAFGGGLELVLASDFAYAASQATFGMPETTVGIMPGAMGTQNLPRACGLRRAKEICFTGGSFSAAEALEWGVVNRICAPDSLMDEVLDVARKIGANAPLAIRQVKKAMAAGETTDLTTGYKIELAAYNELIPTADREEGIRAFNEKRRPQFQGR